MVRILGWIGGVLAAVLAAWLALHVFLSPINPSQERPRAHMSGPCWACHFVTTGAQIREQ